MSGLELDSDTLCLYKMLEPPPTLSAQDTTVFGVIDSGPNGYDMQPWFSSGEWQKPSITWGVRGNAIRTQFARYFFDEGVTSQLRTGLLDATFTSAQITDHTWQIYFKLDTLPGGGGYDLINVDDAATDLLFRVFLLSSGDFRLEWEAAGVLQRYTVSDTGIKADTWHTLHISRAVDVSSTTHFITRVHLDGKVIELIDKDSAWSFGTGLIPTNMSTNHKIILGGFIGDALAGTIAGLRCIEKELTNAEVQEDHVSWENDGVLVVDNHGANTTLLQYNFDEPPEFLDESPNGFHAVSDNGAGPGGMETYEGGNACSFTDFLGTNGRSYRLTGGNILVQNRATPVDFFNRHGREFRQYFNDDISVPEFTLQAFVVLDSRALSGDITIMDYAEDGSTSLETNALKVVTIDATSFVGTISHERGVGVGVTAATPQGVFVNNQQYGLMHVAIRQREDPNVTGNVLVDFFINGSLNQTTASVLPPQGGGNLGCFLKFFDGDAIVQELKLSKVALTDAQILAESSSIGPSAPTIVETPATLTPIDPGDAITIDVTMDIRNPVALSLIWFKYKSSLTYTVAYDGGGFLPPFSGAVTDLVGDGSKLRIIIKADGGWREEIEEMRVRAVGSNGLLDVEI